MFIPSNRMRIFNLVTIGLEMSEKFDMSDLGGGGGSGMGGPPGEVPALVIQVAELEF